MRIPLIYFGLIGAAFGAVFSFVCLAQVHDAKADVTIADAGHSYAVLGNLAESYMGDPSAEVEIDAAEDEVSAAQERLDSWTTRRNIGFSVLALGLVVAGVGFATPRTQQVEVVLPGAGAHPGNPAPSAHPAARDAADGRSVPTTSDTLAARLRTLDELRESGAVTPEEHEARRSAIIDSI